ncbi:MAG: elongation factor Ts [Candidatus Omnitrophota bacterium]
MKPKVVSLDLIKELRQLTSASIANCKQVLEETHGDLAKSQELLRKRGLEIAAKKQLRSAKEGRIESYIHAGSKLGVLLEINCETDFVAKNPDFAQFVKDIAMQIAACDPAYIRAEDIPPEILEKEKDKAAYTKQHCLMEQPFIKDSGLLVKDYLGGIVSKVGESVVIRRYSRYKIGE